MTGSTTMFNGVGSWTPLIISRLVGYVCWGCLLGIRNGKSSSVIRLGMDGLGMDLSENDGSNDGALLGVGWDVGLVGACACGSGGLTTRMAGMSVIFPSSFQSMMGLSIIGLLPSSSSDLPSPVGAGSVQLYCYGTKLAQNILITTSTYWKMR